MWFGLREKRSVFFELGVRGGPMASFAINGDIKPVFGAEQDCSATVGDLVLQVAHLAPADILADSVMLGFVHVDYPFDASVVLTDKYTTFRLKFRAVKIIFCL